jgi:peptide/nickel transport system permease protein
VALCCLPLIPSEHGWRSLWRDRPLTQQVVTQASAANFALFPPIPFRADSTVSGQVLKSPGSVDAASGRRFWLGTDSAGKDVAAQMVLGARISLTVGLVAMGLSLFIGTLIGACSGFFGGWVDLILQRVVEIMMCFPTFILILVVVAMTSRDIFIIMTVIGLTSWADTARLVRGEFLAQSVRDYVLAGRALGLGRLRLMFHHILPNALTPLLITATFGIAGAIGAESGLSFIGLGDPTVATWGGLLEQGRQNIQYGWLIWAPGLAVFALVYALNLVGDGFRKALDVQAR